MHKNFILFFLLLLLILVATGCDNKHKLETTNLVQSAETLSSSSSQPPVSSANDSSEKVASAKINISDIFDQNKISAEMIKVTNSYRDIYKKYHLKQYCNTDKNQREQIVNRIAELGYSVVSPTINMKNSYLVKQFWEEAKAGNNIQLGIYQVELDGSLDRYTFKKCNGKTYLVCISANWNSSNQPEIQFSDMEIVDKFQLTSKGYFLYHTTYKTSAIDGLCDSSNGFRVSPMADKNREFCEKYITPVGYQGNNILTSNWDQKTISKLNFNDMFEYIYLLEYHKEPDSNKYDYYFQNMQNIGTLAVPAADFEKVIIKHFPISVKMLRQTAVYNPIRHVYAWQEFTEPQYVPIPEVVAYKKNTDGSLTLTVDAVETEYYSDCDFTDTVIVMPHKDGSFEYLSNSLKIVHSEQFPTYSPWIVKGK